MENTISLEKPFGTASTGKLAMWLFLVMDGLTFITLLIGGLALRNAAGFWPAAGVILNVPMTAFNTFLLICSSFTMVMALNAIQKGTQKLFIRYLALTVFGGVAFLGIQVYEYSHFFIGSDALGDALAQSGFEGDRFLPSTGLYGAVFYSTTMFHGLHVLSGVIYLGFVLRNGLKGKYTTVQYDQVEIAGLFWHFVDLIWILVFTLIYLL